MQKYAQIFIRIHLVTLNKCREVGVGNKSYLGDALRSQGKESKGRALLEWQGIKAER